jgi:hypothetical protein
MKGNIKKQAVLVIITVIALFIMAPWASAGSSGHHAIRGQYAVTGGNTCLISPSGFNANLQPNAGWGIIQTSSREGDFRFELNGTGSAEVTSRNVVLPYQVPPAIPNPLAGGTQEITFDFTYTLKKDGTITIIVGPGPFTSNQITGPDAGVTFYITGVSMDGVITPDGKTITLNAGAPDVYTITRSDNPNIMMKSICHSSSVLIWQHE